MSMEWNVLFPTRQSWKATFFLNAIKVGMKPMKVWFILAHLEYSKHLMKSNYKMRMKTLIDHNKLPHYSTTRKNWKANLAGINVELDEYKREIDKIEIERSTTQSVANLNIWCYLQ
jgi:hypothetical protein